ncbi:hypothetical protein NDU88_004965 [Pleurodeles waltl]|uniref:Uncharacterized protein n=1 Tax=Pleurodeles waltl TaxID=8319 RepID=A0AAV7WWX9_PLEWA|nr:hypothetical protein NDU88_004965 [Pleurodeles waltl]
MQGLLPPQAKAKLERLFPSPGGMLDHRNRVTLEPCGATDHRRGAGNLPYTGEGPCADGRGLPQEFQVLLLPARGRSPLAANEAPALGKESFPASQVYTATEEAQRVAAHVAELSLQLAGTRICVMRVIQEFGLPKSKA